MTEPSSPVSRDRAEDVRRHHEARILALPGVTGFDLEGSDADATFVVYVADIRDLAPELRGLTELDGVPVEITERRYTLH